MGAEPNPRTGESMSITPTEALARCIDHREIFHDEMLKLMRMIMSGEMSPVMIAALTIGLRVSEEQEREGLDLTSHGERAYHS